jgi:hypothetical protein
LLFFLTRATDKAVYGCRIQRRPKSKNVEGHSLRPKTQIVAFLFFFAANASALFFLFALHGGTDVITLFISSNLNERNNNVSEYEPPFNGFGI